MRTGEKRAHRTILATLLAIVSAACRGRSVPKANETTDPGLEVSRTYELGRFVGMVNDHVVSCIRYRVIGSDGGTGPRSVTP